MNGLLIGRIDLIGLVGLLGSDGLECVHTAGSGGGRWAVAMVRVVTFMMCGGDGFLSFFLMSDATLHEITCDPMGSHEIE